MTSTSRLRLVILVVGAVMLAVAGCGADDEPETGADEPSDVEEDSDDLDDSEEGDSAGAEGPVVGDADVRYAWSIPLASLDPHTTPSDFDPIYLGLAYDTLLVKEFDGSFSPMLAESWEFVAEDQLEFSLRSGVTFQGGREFDAEAVALNFERATTGDAESRGAPLAAAVDRVEVIDPLTVRMYLGDGAGAVLGALSSLSGMIINPDAFDDDLSMTADGTGPYRVVDVDSGVGVTYERFDDTWATEDARAGGIEIVTNVDSAQRVNLLLTGDIDATNIDTFQIDLVEEEGYSTHFRVGTDAWVVQLNWDRLTDLTTRQAILAAIDRDAIAAGVHDDVAQSGGQIQTVDDPGYNPNLPSPEIDRALDLAQEAGMAGETLQLLTAGVPMAQATAEAIQPMIEQLGVNVDVTLVEFGQLSSEWATGEYDVSVIYFTGSADNAISYRRLLGAESVLNPAGEAPGGVEELIAEAFAETDDVRRNEIFQELAAVTHEEALLAVPVHPVQPIVTAPDVVIDEDRLRLFGGFNLRGIGKLEG